MTLRSLRAADGEILDRGLVTWFPAPASYTGDDCAELYLHGGKAVLQAVFEALVAAGAQAAEPGDFTRRAFLNGKMDLLEAEGVADLISADTVGQRRQALQLLGGAQSAVLMGWAERLRRALAWQEALIDFPDEDLPASVERELLGDVEAVSVALAESVQAVRRGARIRQGIVVAIIGPPNAGKSSLMNALARRDVAIVSAQPGTTRDALEAWIEVAGVPVCLVDTAGLRETADEVEAEGVRRARARAEAADLVLNLCDAAAPHLATQDPRGREFLRIANKTDRTPAPPGWLGVSALTGAGLDALRNMIGAEVLRLTDTSGHPVLSQARHEGALREALACLERARAATFPELRGEELRLAMRALGRITGSVGVEDLLDTVFGSFCIGK